MSVELLDEHVIVSRQTANLMLGRKFLSAAVSGSELQRSLPREVENDSLNMERRKDDMIDDAE